MFVDLTITRMAVLVLVLNAAVTCVPIEKYVLDTTTFQNELNWDKVAYGDSFELPGWKEQSFTQKNGDVWRAHFVCDISSANPDNWMRTPYIHREEANRFTVRLDYTIRECKKYPGAIRSCKETFQLMYAESDDASRPAPNFNETNYKYLKTIAPSQRQTVKTTTSSIAVASPSSSSSSSTIYRTDIDVALSSKGVYFAFRDQGACVSILSIKVYYTLCAPETDNLTVFPRTPTGASVTDLVQRTGSCVDNAEAKTTQYAYCQANGNWFMTNTKDDNTGVNMSCMCKAGYFYLQSNSTQCLACPSGTYKHRSGNEACSPCPENSWSPGSAYKHCACLAGFYRPNYSQYDAPCILTPTEPKNLTVYHVDETSVKLRWNSIGEYKKNAIKYILTCHKCARTTDANNDNVDKNVDCQTKVPCETYIQYTPNKEQIFTNQVILSSMDSDTQYFIEIYAQHTKNVFRTKTVDLAVRTNKAVYSGDSIVYNITCIQIDMRNEYYLYWQITKDIREYEIKYWPLNESKANARLKSIAGSSILNYTFVDLNPNSAYGFQIRCRTVSEGTWSTYTTQIESTKSSTTTLLDKAFPLFNTANAVSTASSTTTTTYVLFAFVIGLCLVMSTLAFAFYIRRKITWPKTTKTKSTSSSSSSSTTHSDCDSIDIAKSNSHSAYNNLTSSTTSGGSTTPTPPLIWLQQQHQTLISHQHKTYIDPHTYEDPTKAVNEFARELCPSNIIIESVIGGGEFGDVCKGYLKHMPWSQTTVAIKTLKCAASEQNRCDFLTEASIMAQFDNTNVIRLEGVVTKTLPLMIVTEYMENGSLDTFLRVNENQLDNLGLCKILYDVASGMRYLAEMNFIHRDLAARNILVNRDRVCKVADFGLSREIEMNNDNNALSDGVYTTKGGKIPIRWTAPEAINFRKFTCASDVWSYGVLGWEVLTYAERPYWNWTNQDVIKAVEKGYRLPTPSNCPQVLYDLLLKCWHPDRLLRPRFVDIVIILDNLINSKNSESILSRMATDRESLAINPNSPTYIQLTSTKQFLCQIKLEQYVDAFERQYYLNLSQLFHLDVNDLTVNFAIRDPNHHKIIMDSLNYIRTHFNSYYNNRNTLTTTKTTLSPIEPIKSTVNGYLV